MTHKAVKLDQKKKKRQESVRTAGGKLFSRSKMQNGRYCFECVKTAKRRFPPAFCGKVQNMLLARQNFHFVADEQRRKCAPNAAVYLQSAVMHARTYCGVQWPPVGAGLRVGLLFLFAIPSPRDCARLPSRIPSWTTRTTSSRSLHRSNSSNLLHNSQ